jgi:hypothetical protein
MLRLGSLALLLAFACASLAADLSFSRRVMFDAPYTPAVADLFNNGRLQFLGTQNIGGGVFDTASPRAMKLDPLFGTTTQPLPDSNLFYYVRRSRDTRLADLDNDGRVDAVNNVYWCNGDPQNAAQLYFQQPNGTFSRSTQFDTLGITGRGETIVAADFDNDGYLDLYIPHYTRADSHPDSLFECATYAPNGVPGKAWLLRNRGAAGPGVFYDAGPTPVDLTEANCGVDCGNVGDPPITYSQPEGAQAIDYDEDGNIDLMSSGMLFRNAGNAQFTRVWPPAGEQPFFDEGLKFIDWNNDGYPDLVRIDPATGLIHLYSWVGGIRDANGTIVAGHLGEVTDPIVIGAFQANAAPGTYGLAAGDVNGDGYDDIVINAGQLDGTPKIFLNQGPPTYAFKLATVTGFWGLSGRSGHMIADVNFDGRPDIVQSSTFGNRTTYVNYNTSTTPSPNTLIVEVLGGTAAQRLRNQQGRVVHVTPAAGGGMSYTRYIDGGSGYMAQTPYAVTVYSAYAGAHTISVRGPTATVQCTVTPPAYVLMPVDGSGCTVLPLPPAQPIAYDHTMRALDEVIRLAAADPGDDAVGSDSFVADFDGDHSGDLLWHNRSTGETALWLMNGATYKSGAILLNSYGWEPQRVADFDGDGKSDILWRNRFTGVTSMWTMNGAAFKSGATLMLDPAWRVTHVGDFDGDGKADLVWRNESTGATAIWLMNGTQFKAGAVLLTDRNWRVTHVADFNGDHRSDLVWYNEATGATAVWLMNGTQMASGDVVLVDRAWQVEKTGDFDGDGKADLLWRNNQTGLYAMWLMNGVAPKASAALSTNPGDRAKVVGDLDGDGRADIVWRNDKTGTTSATLMNGLSIVGTATLLSLPQWHVSAAGDLNGDGKADLLWRDVTTGRTAVWLMNGLQMVGGDVVLDNALWSTRGP